MYIQVGDFPISRGPPTVPLRRISCNTVFSKAQNACKAGTLFTLKKKFGADNEQLLRPVFLCFNGQKINSISVRTKKLHRVKVKKEEKNWEVFLRGKNQFF